MIWIITKYVCFAPNAPFLYVIPDDALNVFKIVVKIIYSHGFNTTAIKREENLRHFLPPLQE